MAKRKRADGDEVVLRRSTRGQASAAPEPVKATKAKAPAKATKTTKKTITKTTKAEAKAEPATAPETPATESKDTSSPARQYWLLKAEPETRLENGVDVRFSIDDLRACTEPEPWDGIRNYAARNNLRAMRKGDLAFFYHSNCKPPGLVGTMEIVREHSPDESAHDPTKPYYDASSSPANPKWSVVHVVFRSKFRTPIHLPQLRADGAPGRPLEHMQLLRQSRLSVSRVSAAEWAYLMGVVAATGGEIMDGEEDEKKDEE